MSETWDEIRTAYHVARLGTVSAAAEALGVHHATVIRHVDALEQRLRVKLFQRHARGYTPTEAGLDLLAAGQETDERLTQLVARLRGGGDAMRGELVVTSLGSLSQLLTPILGTFAAANPDLLLRYLTHERLFRMETGEAHVAVRAGPPAADPDYVVQPFVGVDVGLYGAASYLDAYGTPAGEADLAAHRFVGLDGAEPRAPFERWLRGAVPANRVVFRGSDERVLADAVEAGIGLGFVWDIDARRRPGLRRIMPSRPEWTAPLSLVTHVDLHRSPKVQALLQHLKAAAPRAAGGEIT